MFGRSKVPKPLTKDEILVELSDREVYNASDDSAEASYYSERYMVAHKRELSSLPYDEKGSQYVDAYDFRLPSVERSQRDGLINVGNGRFVEPLPPVEMDGLFYVPPFALPISPRYAVLGQAYTDIIYEKADYRLISPKDMIRLAGGQSTRSDEDYIRAAFFALFKKRWAEHWNVYPETFTGSRQFAYSELFIDAIMVKRALKRQESQKS